MEIFSYSTKKIPEIEKEFNVNLTKGLTEKEVSQRLLKFGQNVFNLKKTTAWQILFRQFKSVFIYLIFVALLITLFLGELIDSFMIIIFLFINTTLGFYQDYTSEKTAELLKRYALPRTKVLRNGKIEQIISERLVPGDIVILETGDKVPADIRLFEADNLLVDESVLTGESIPVFKKSDLLKEEPSSCYKALNLVFMGTNILKGESRGIVLACGHNTIFGKIAKLSTETKKVSEFEKEIFRFSKFIIKLIAATTIFIFLAQLIIGSKEVNILNRIVFLVALTISVIPEALPLVTTFSLARGAKKMAKKDVIVKRLSAVEDLGSIEILCSDKTGTLTENKLTIANFFSKNKKETIWLANLASSFELKNKIEPFDIALEKALDYEQKNKIKKVIKISEDAFDPNLRMNSVMVKDGNKIFLIIRGAPEKIISLCNKIDDKIKNEIHTWLEKEGKAGKRTLAIAYKSLNSEENVVYSKEIEKRNFIFSGIISFSDPIKKSSFQAIKEAKKLGVRIMIITGDSSETAGIIAKEIGLINSEKKVINAQEWKKADIKEKEIYLNEYSVISRATPEDKFLLINELRKKYTVGFLGEGINDAPALKAAGISIVVNSAADIAREAADVILLKKSLEVVIEGIKEGRQVFANTTKYIKSTLSSNFGNFFSIAFSSFFINFLPMLPSQILLVNLLTDAPMISISLDSVEKKELRSPRKYQTKDIISLSLVLGIISAVFDLIIFSVFHKSSPQILQTNWFIASVLTEITLLFSIRTTGIFNKAPRPPYLITALTGIVLILTLFFPFSNYGRKIFKFTTPHLTHLAFILILTIIYFFLSEKAKVLYYKKRI